MIVILEQDDMHDCEYMGKRPYNMQVMYYSDVVLERLSDETFRVIKNRHSGKVGHTITSLSVNEQMNSIREDDLDTQNGITEQSQEMLSHEEEYYRQLDEDMSEYNLMLRGNF